MVLFYHFAFLAISIALLGLGAGGVCAFVGKQKLERFPLRKLAVAVTLAGSALMVVALEVTLRTPVSLALHRGNLIRLTAIYFACAAPFFCAGLLFAILYAREPERISRYYGADLLGGAAACLALGPLLAGIGGPNTVLVSALAMAASGMLWAGSRRGRVAAVVGAAVFVILIGGNLVAHGKIFDIVFAKGMRRDQPWVLFSKWNAISRVEVDQNGNSKWIVIDADASSAIMSADPAQWQAPAVRNQLMSAAPAVVNALRPTGDYAIIGPGGGVDVLRALVAGSRNVTAIEINPIIANDIMRGRYADHAYRLYQRPEVHLHVQDGRSFIRGSKDQYGVIQMTLVDTWASTAAGAFALSENNLYTVEAFKEYFAHLKPDGMIAITRWEFRQPREALRVVSQAMEALREMGVADARANLIVVSEGELNVDGRPVLVLAKKSAFTKDEIARYREFIAASGGKLHEIYSPLYRQDHDLVEPQDILVRSPNEEAFAALIECSEPGARDSLIEQYPYNISPVTDDAPFFFFTFKTRRLFGQLVNRGEHGIDWKVNLGVAVLFMLLAISVVAVAGFLFLPLWIHAPARGAPLAPLGYFIALGLGYILVEITFIQRFVLFLGNPTYALTVVIFLMLLASGAGSMASRKLLSGTRAAVVPLGVVIALLALDWIFLPRVLSALVGIAFPLKLALSALFLVPLGFAMGMPFPVGLRAISATFDSQPELSAGANASVEWAWAMNAAASVLGSVAAMVIAVNFGLGATLLTGAGAYALAAAFIPGIAHSRNWKMRVALP